MPERSSVYSIYRYEVWYRQDSIVKAINQANTVADLRAALEKKVFFNSEFKDKSTPELLPIYRAAGPRVVAAGGEYTAQRAMMASPDFGRYGTVYYGYLVDDFTEAQLAELKAYNLLVSLADIEQFFGMLKTIYEPVCTPRTLVKIALGGRPVLVRARETSFTEREWHDEHLDE